LTEIRDIKLYAKKPVVVKGIMCAEDALIAVGHGADAIWISNSGGRSMDTLPSTISVLNSISKAVKTVNPKVQIFIDGGVRRGTDVAKCLGLGADLVFLGRPVAWGLHFGAKEGLISLISMLHEEFKIVMCLTNSMDISQITE
jgi:isopentenyl diphosphate isomerase/L-lactate dehydrogenase-like FMN-dependent dehydrogenase